MSTDIQRLAVPRQPLELAPKMTSAPAASTAAAPELRPIELYQPSRPDIQVDTQERLKNLQSAIEQINSAMRDGGRGLSFVIDNVIDQPIIKVMRAETGEVIRQIPNEVVVRVAHNLEKLQGILFSDLA